ncbi:MAG: hypothetical protein AAGF75_01170 [Cyanobacteria bacterium P01_H01_bin.130]
MTTSDPVSGDTVDSTPASPPGDVLKGAPQPTIITVAIAPVPFRSAAAARRASGYA